MSASKYVQLRVIRVHHAFTCARTRYFAPKGSKIQMDYTDCTRSVCSVITANDGDLLASRDLPASLKITVTVSPRRDTARTSRFPSLDKRRFDQSKPDLSCFPLPSSLQVSLAADFRGSLMQYSIPKRTFRRTFQ